MSNFSGDPATTPFSCFGSWMCFSILSKHRLLPQLEKPALFFRNCRKLYEFSPLLELQLLDGGGRPVPFRSAFSTSVLVLEAGEAGRCEITFQDADRVLFRVIRGALRLLQTPGVSRLGQIFRSGNGCYRMTYRLPDYTNCFYHLAPFSAEPEFDRRWDGMNTVGASLTVPAFGGRPAEFMIVESEQEFIPGEQERVSFETAAAAQEASFRRFAAGFPQVAPEFRRAGEEAVRLIWSEFVRKEGFLTRDTLLMSKSYMSATWSWDHAFAALGLAGGHPRMAFDQFMVLFDNRNRQGALPDMISGNVRFTNYTKPPVHGWVFRRMRKMNPAFFSRPEILEEVFPALSAWTDYWLVSRDLFRDGHPVYFHGNDSGWDNATVFLRDTPLSTPELPAYLAVQLDVVAELADALGRPAEAARRRTERDALVECLLRDYRSGGEFCAVFPGGGKLRQPGDSLLCFMPLAAGRLLPPEVRDRLIAGLKQPGRFRSRYGLCTEALSSPLYQPDGYWRGPVWPPSTLLLFGSLLELGETQFAGEIASGWCELCRNSGFRENFDGETGAGYREYGYAWTAAIFLLLAGYLNLNPAVEREKLHEPATIPSGI